MLRVPDHECVNLSLSILDLRFPKTQGGFKKKNRLALLLLDPRAFVLEAGNYQESPLRVNLFADCPIVGWRWCRDLNKGHTGLVVVKYRCRKKIDTQKVVDHAPQDPTLNRGVL